MMKIFNVLKDRLSSREESCLNFYLERFLEKREERGLS